MALQPRTDRGRGNRICGRADQVERALARCAEKRLEAAGLLEMKALEIARAALSPESSGVAEQLDAISHLRRLGCDLPGLHRLGAKSSKLAVGHEVVLKVEAVVDGGMG
jgi:hypothetical protein